MSEQQKPVSRKTIMIVGIVMAVITLACVVGVILYFVLRKKEPELAGKTLWLMAGEDHSEDVTYVEAVVYCALSKGRLSTVPELMEAYNQGFEYCYPGWMLDHYLGYVMQNANDPSCPNSKNEKGCNCRSVSNIPDLRYGVYCIADTLPTDDPLIKTCHVFK